MTDDEVRARCEELVNVILGITQRTPAQQEARVQRLIAFYRAVMVEGMERAAAINESFMREHIASAPGVSTLHVATKRIRQAAKEVRSE